MNKGTHFIGQPVFGQLINLLDKEKIAKISRENGGEKFIKKLDAWQHLVISVMPKRSTLSDANARRPECVFEAIYRGLYGRYRKELSSAATNDSFMLAPRTTAAATSWPWTGHTSTTASSRNSPGWASPTSPR